MDPTGGLGLEHINFTHNSNKMIHIGNVIDNQKETCGLQSKHEKGLQLISKYSCVV